MSEHTNHSFISDPKGLMKLKFKCPQCGGFRFGTSFATSPNATGHCSSCHYTWLRKDDTGHFVNREENR